MKVKQAAFTGLFVAIVTFFLSYFIPESTFKMIILPIIVGLSAWVGGLIAKKWLKEPEN